MGMRALLRRATSGPGLVVPVAAFGLLIGGLAAGETPADLDGAAAGVRAEETVVAACTDVLVLAARGAGEKGRKVPYGPTLQPLVDRLVDQVRQHDRSVTVERVRLKASGVRHLVRDDATGKTRARRATTPNLVRAWSTDVAGAAVRVEERLTQAATACPDQQLVLVGYSQGAMVMHRALLAVEGRADITSRLVGLGLVADGDRARNAPRVKGAPAAEGGRGIATRHLGEVHGVPAGGSTVGVWNVCTAGDLVCDHRANRLRDAKRAHRGYAAGKAAKKVARVGKVLGNRVARWALPPVGTEQVAGQADMLLQHQLGVRIRPGNRSDVVWGDAQGLPEGLSLTTTGRIEGTPREGGVHEVTFTVHNAASPAFAHRAVGRLRLTVSDAAATALTTGGNQTCRVQEDGTAVCWGRNNWGQFGNGTTAGTRAPVPAADGAWRRLSTSGSATCGIREDGSLWCWGLNQYGQVGDGTTTTRKVPTRVGTSRGWTDVSTGWAHTCALRKNGTAWCWGYNKVGQVGDDTTRLRKTPRKVVGDVGRWTDITAGGFFSCGTTADGKAWCWGANAFGQLGNGTRAGSRTPVPVGFTSDWAAVEASWYSACGLKTTDELRCWGLNEQGQLGDGTQESRVWPTLSGGGASFRDLAVGEAHVCGVRTDDTLSCWGDNTYGQLGTGAPALSRQPVTPADADGWSSVEAGWLHTCGVKKDGTTWCWGNNEFGQVGDGTATDRTSAVPVS